MSKDEVLDVQPSSKPGELSLHSLDLSPEPVVSRPNYWLDELDMRKGDLALFACCFTTGLLDTSTFKNWTCFVSMQTGNSIILSLSSAGYPIGQPYAYATTLISLIAFFLGTFVITRIRNALGSTRRIVLTLNFLTQSGLIIIAAALATSNVLVNDQNHTSTQVLHDPRILIAIGPLAFQSGATIATSRLLGFGNEIPVTVYTSTYAALAGDPKLFQWHGNTPRNRRVIAVICLFAGAFVSTWIEKDSVGMVATFWMSAGVKLLIAAAVAFVYPTKAK